MFVHEPAIALEAAECTKHKSPSLRSSCCHLLPCCAFRFEALAVFVATEIHRKAISVQTIIAISRLDHPPSHIIYAVELDLVFVHGSTSFYGNLPPHIVSSFMRIGSMGIRQINNVPR